MQERGRLRRQELLDAARTLLATHELDALSLGAVADHAAMPKASAYHFFASIHDLYAELSRTIAEEVRADQLRPIAPPPTRWQAVMEVAIDRGAAFFNASAAATQLLLGPKSPPEIKRSDRSADRELGRSIQAQIRRSFALPALPDQDGIFFRAVEIGDLMFGLSVLEHGTISDAYREEAKRAALAYLGLYLPSILPKAD